MTSAPGRTILPDSRVSPRFAGVCTFCRYPLIADVRPENRPLDWAIYGVPYDTGVTFRPGARFGPRAVREASQYVKRFHLEHEVDVCSVLSLADAGDAPVKPYDLQENLSGVAAWATTLGEPSTKLFAVGGDHSIAYANLRATWERQGKPAGGLALAHFDSHLDTVDAVWGERWGHASPFIRAIEDGLIDPRAMVSVGIKGPLNTANDLTFARDRGVTIIPRQQLGQGGETRLRDFATELGNRPTYITFDVDVVDPAFAPGTGTPCPGGITTSEAFTLLRSLKSINVVGGDVVEVLPDRDVSGITAFFAAHVMFEVIALDALRRAGAVTGNA